MCRIYYQQNPERLSACPLTIHGLLHVCDNIRFCGPVWTTWTFWMERYCGYLQAGLKSDRHPWANLNKRIIHQAYVDQVELIYDLGKSKKDQSNQIGRYDKIFDKCKL